MIADNPTCQDVVVLVTEYLEEALPAAERARFEAHLAACPGCAIYLRQMQRTIKALGTLTEETIPADTMAELLRGPACILEGLVRRRR